MRAIGSVNLYADPFGPLGNAENRLKHFFAVFTVSLRFALYDGAIPRKADITMRKYLVPLLAAVLSVCMIFFLGATYAAAETSAYIFSYDDMFTTRDLKQTADLVGSVDCVVTDGQDIHITSAGVYVLTGSAKDVTVFVEAGKDDKVQLVLDGLAITNGDAPVIYVKSADKVFVTISGDSALAVTGSFDKSDKADGVIFSKADLVLNGSAVLTLSSTENGVVGKDDLKITGGTYRITAKAKAVEANDSIRIADGTLYLVAGTDGLHAENEDDDSLGYIYIAGGSITVQAGDDAIHAVSAIQINDGALSLTAAEGIEATCVQINGGTVSISARDDGINGARKSSAYTTKVEINGGDITVVMASGDTDGIDSNGDIVVNGGTINVTGSSSFDCDGSAQYNGGTIIVNGQQLSYIPNQMMGGGRGGMGGMGGMGGWGRRGG